MIEQTEKVTKYRWPKTTVTHIDLHDSQLLKNNSGHLHVQVWPNAGTLNTSDTLKDVYHSDYDKIKILNYK